MDSKGGKRLQEHQNPILKKKGFKKKKEKALLLQ